MKIFITDQGKIRGENPVWKFPHPDHTKDNLYFSCLKRAKDHSIEFERKERFYNELEKRPAEYKIIKDASFKPGIYEVSLPKVEMVGQQKRGDKWYDIEQLDPVIGFPEYRTVFRFVERKEEIIEREMKYFEVYCLNFSKVIHADSLFSAVLEFVKDHPLERVILAEDTVLFHLAKEVTSPESQGFIPCGQGDNHCNCKSKEECGYIESQEEQPVIFDDFLREVYKGLREKKNPIDISLDLQEKFTITRRTKPDSQKFGCEFKFHLL
jgi:hypothetical protein